MNKKTLTMLELFVVYAIGFAIGAIIYVFLKQSVENAVIRMLIADLAMTILLWVYGLLRRNSSVYDPYWSVVPPIILMGWMLDSVATWTIPTILLFLGVTCWAVRLTFNWALGWTDFSDQDWRYTMIRDKHPRLWPIANLFGIMLMPTIIVFIQLIGSHELIALQASANAWSWIGFFMIVGAAIIQFIADGQMRRFKTANKGSKQCIEEGLWKWSRHPNYFGEVTVWWGVYVMYVGVTGRLNMAILPPILMTALFLFISIPMMENKILATRPEYANYQERVSMLVPLPQRRQKDHGVSVNE
jgi:steroid 5-alpha reductase family enzyme